MPRRPGGADFDLALRRFAAGIAPIIVCEI
jgi:hypothetical protein